MEKILPIHIGMALKSLRNSDFDAYSAIGEVIDNSLVAETKEIKIRIKSETPPGKRVSKAKTIAFGDDGVGMDPDTLQLCLKLGYSGKYDDRKGLGRFGVGMTLGAISLCEKIEVYSRQKRGNWHYTFLDISNISQDVEPEIHPMENKEPPKEYEDLVGDYGTLVIWDKIDRIEPDFDIDELKHWIGRTYRKFIGTELIKDKKIIPNTNIRKIFVNEELVTAHDPLYVTANLKRPKDKKATLHDDVTFPFRTHEVDAPTSGEKRGMVTIRTSLLPAEWRLHAARSGRSAENNARRVYENEGFSILRNGREVYYDTIPNFKPAHEELDRFWGCEIDFDPNLDHWFSVKNIKVGARPLRELREELQKRLQGIILNNFRKKIRETYDETKRDEATKSVGPILSHKEKEEQINNITSPLKTNLTPQEIEENLNQTAELLFDDPVEKEQYKKELKDPETKFKFIEDSKGRSDGIFIDVIPNLGTKVIHYNMNHPFFLSVYTKINDIRKIAETNEPINQELISLANKLKDDLDNLLYAYAEGIYDLDDLQRQQRVNETLEELLVKWSYHLRKTYKSQSI